MRMKYLTATCKMPIFQARQTLRKKNRFKLDGLFEKKNGLLVV